MRAPTLPFAAIVRHAHAGSPHEWPGSDLSRPLTAKGWQQAEGFAASASSWSIGRILSSPAVRCVETVTPLAKALTLDIEPMPWLIEGEEAVDVVVAELSRAGTHGVVASMHGDGLLPQVLIGLATSRGIELDREPDTPKGAFWVFELGDEPRVRYKAARG